MDVHSQFQIAVTCYFAQIEGGIHFMNTKIEKKYMRAQKISDLLTRTQGKIEIEFQIYYHNRNTLIC